MRFQTDSYFTIGAAHLTAGKPCQDYAVGSEIEHGAMIVVSDGCSTGGKTDVGARVVAHATLASASGYPAHRRLSEKRDDCLKAVREKLSLDPSDMLATCLYAHVFEGYAVMVVQGDGVLAIKYRSGKIHMSRFEWLDNTPFYPAYSEADRERFVTVHGGDLWGLRLESSEVLIENGKKDTWIERFAIHWGMSGIDRRCNPAELSEIEAIAIFSDGVTQIENVDWTEAVQEFLNFKNTASEFAKRRMIRGLKDLRERGKGPIDDISYAVIHIEHE